MNESMTQSNESDTDFSKVSRFFKDQEGLRNGHRLEEMKETWQLNAR